MIIRCPNCMLISENSNNVYWEEGLYPDWAVINTFRNFTGRKGQGTEPHYHDGDEMWLFTSGRGEVWLDERSFEVTSNTAVYTPMGVMHRFQIFTDYEVIAVVTRLERQKRATHILVEEAGPPTPTVSGFVVSGSSNEGPFANRGSRCPLSEFRSVTLGAGEEIAQARLPSNEYWLVLAGTVDISIDGLTAELSPGDVALLKAGAVRCLRGEQGARLALARE